MQYSIARMLRATVWGAFLMASFRFTGILGSVLMIVFLAIADLFTYHTYLNWRSLSRNEKLMGVFSAGVSLGSLAVYFGSLMVHGN